MGMAPGPEAEVFHFESSVSGMRLDRYLAQLLPKFSRSYLQRLIQEGYVVVNRGKAKAGRRLNRGDVIAVKVPSQPNVPVPEPIPLIIVYEDNDIIVVDKPPGLVVHPAPGHSDHTLVNAILAHCPDLAPGGDRLRPGIVHRLDKDTSGLMVVAKNESAREYLISQFKNRAVTKGYLVLVKGKLFPEVGIIEAPIGRDPRRRKRMTVVDGGKEARTQYQVRQYLGSYTLLEVVPFTGRTHQIRVHLAAIGHPVIGDPVYGVKSACLARQFIHAFRLGFRLPSTAQYQEFISPLPEDLQQALECLAQHS